MAAAASLNDILPEIIPSSIGPESPGSSVPISRMKVSLARFSTFSLPVASRAVAEASMNPAIVSLENSVLTPAPPIRASTASGSLSCSAMLSAKLRSCFRVRSCSCAIARLLPSVVSASCWFRISVFASMFSNCRRNRSSVASSSRLRALPLAVTVTARPKPLSAPLNGSPMMTS